MKKTLRKLLSLLLCVVFAAGVLPMTAGAQTITQYSKGDVIEFGWYPQTKETDSRILAHLNAAAPAWESWTSYGYYSGSGNSHDGQMKPDDFMRYTDIVVDGVKYRAMTTLEPGKKDPIERMFYFDLNKPFPDLKPGDPLHVVYHDHEVVSLTRL